MTLRLAVLGTLTLAAVLPGVAFADDHGRDRDDRRGHEDEYRDGRRVWVAGHVEDRESRRVVPAVVRDEWGAERCETVVIPAVTEEVRVPAVVERVFRPAVVERSWIPEVRERTIFPGHFELRIDRQGCEFRIWIAARAAERVVREGRWEERCVTPAHFEERVVRPERCETRIVVPERCEVRVVERAHLRQVVVCAERVELTVERVWVPGHFETRPERQRT